MRGRASAQEREPATGPVVGVADVEKVLRNYGRASRVKNELERGNTSEELRQKQVELDDLEREVAGKRFSFFRRKISPAEVEKKRTEVQALREQEARAAREKEKKEMEALLTDVRGAVAEVGREKRLALVFDSNAPQILFLNPRAGGVTDVSDAAIEWLNSDRR
ncbi:OmpH family outer membrane protein [Candidatus Poribacteria bacterium]|nr:OmpH family outer membrane protein [Candidatus Poribacteria bacterium]